MCAAAESLAEAALWREFLDGDGRVEAPFEFVFDVAARAEFVDESELVGLVAEVDAGFGVANCLGVHVAAVGDASDEVVVPFVDESL